jgi:hypothetical protein
VRPAAVDVSLALDCAVHRKHSEMHRLTYTAAQSLVTESIKKNHSWFHDLVVNIAHGPGLSTDGSCGFYLYVCVPWQRLQGTGA